jgi:anti-sigma factor RsiW
MRPSCEAARQELSAHFDGEAGALLPLGPGVVDHLRACPSCRRFEADLGELDSWLRRGSLFVVPEPRRLRLPARVKWAVRARRLPVFLAGLVLPLAVLHAFFPVQAEHRPSLTPCTRAISQGAGSHTPAMTRLPLFHQR